jgi:hypothetical protein
MLFKGMFPVRLIVKKDKNKSKNKNLETLVFNIELKNSTT